MLGYYPSPIPGMQGVMIPPNLPVPWGAGPNPFTCPPPLRAPAFVEKEIERLEVKFDTEQRRAVQAEVRLSNACLVIESLKAQYNALYRKKAYSPSDAETADELRRLRGLYDELSNEHRELLESSETEIADLQSQLSEAQTSEDAEITALRAELEQKRGLVAELLEQQKESQANA
eukprot:817721-Rhodomonas_salina.1